MVLLSVDSYVDHRNAIIDNVKRPDGVTGQGAEQEIGLVIYNLVVAQIIGPVIILAQKSTELLNKHVVLPSVVVL
jgi:hypothetical protein